MIERMRLVHLRARIRAGAYQDDLYALEERRQLFLRWLVQQGWVNEWQVADEARHEEQEGASYVEPF